MDMDLMTDWMTWPIFLIQVFAFLLLFLPKSTTKYSRFCITVLLLVVCVSIVLSVYHDSTDPLNLYF